MVLHSSVLRCSRCNWRRWFLHVLKVFRLAQHSQVIPVHHLDLGHRLGWHVQSRTLIWNSWKGGDCLSHGTIYTRSGSGLGRWILGNQPRTTLVFGWGGIVNAVSLRDCVFLLGTELIFRLPAVTWGRGGDMTEFWALEDKRKWCLPLSN